MEFSKYLLTPYVKLDVSTICSFVEMRGRTEQISVKASKRSPVRRRFNENGVRSVIRDTTH